MHGGLSDVRRKAEKTQSSTLIQKTQNFSWKPGGYGTSWSRVNAFKNVDVWFLLQLYQTKVSKLDVAIYWHKFRHVSNSNW